MTKRNAVQRVQRLVIMELVTQKIPKTKAELWANYHKVFGKPTPEDVAMLQQITWLYPVSYEQALAALVQFRKRAEKRAVARYKKLQESRPTMG